MDLIILRFVFKNIWHTWWPVLDPLLVSDGLLGAPTFVNLAYWTLVINSLWPSDTPYGLGNSLSPIWWQPLPESLLTNREIGIKLHWNSSEKQKFSVKDMPMNKIAVILFMTQCVTLFSLQPPNLMHRKVIKTKRNLTRTVSRWLRMVASSSVKTLRNHKPRKRVSLILLFPFWQDLVCCLSLICW